MKIKKIMSFFLMLTLLVTVNLVPSFAGNGNPDIQVVFNGGSGAGKVEIFGYGEVSYPDPATEFITLTEEAIGSSITIQVIPAVGSKVTRFDVEQTSYLDKEELTQIHTIKNIQNKRYQVKVRFDLAEATTTNFFTVTTGKTGEGDGSVTVSIDGVTQSGPGPYSVEEGKKVIVTATPDADSVFAGWDEDPDYGLNNEYVINSIDDDYTLTAIFEPEEQENPNEPVTYTVTTGTAGGGSGTVSVLINDEEATSDDGVYSGIMPGSKVVFKATPEAGSVFAGWDEDPDYGLNNEYVINSIDDDYTLTAIFEPETPEDEGGNSENPDPEVPENPGNETPSNPGPSPTYYTLNVVVEGPGSISPAGGTYAAGTIITLNPVPGEGARFAGWFGTNGADVGDDNRLIMNGSKNIIARFEEIPAEEEELVDDDIPESGEIAEEEEEIISDDDLPQSGEVLPQTGGMPIEILYGLGFALMGGGISLSRRGSKKAGDNK